MPFRTSDILHVLEIYQGIISARPLEMGNGEFLRCLLVSSKRLGEALTTAPRNADLRSNEIQTLSALLKEQNTANAKGVAGKMLATLAEVKSRRDIARRTTPLYVRGSLPALSRDYKHLIVIFGPALGLGDQITFLQFLQQLARHCAHASMTIFSLYPNLWRQFFPQAKELHYRGQPLRPFDHLGRRKGGAEEEKELVVIADFDCFNFHTKVITRRANRDILELALGRRSVWLRRGDSAWVRYEEFFSALLSNNYYLLSGIARQLFPAAADSSPWQPHRAQGTGRRPRRKLIFLNPFSSKKIPLQPIDWQRLLVRIKATLPSDFEFQVVVYPGLDSSTRHYASEICRLAAEDRPRIHATMLGAEAAEATAFNALLHLTAALERVDLCLTVDTFTAHLVPLFAIPTIVITLGENRMFWVPGRWSFYCLLDSLNRVPHALAAQLLLTHSRPERQRREFLEAARKLLSCSESAREDGCPEQIVGDIQEALIETLRYAGPTFPFHAQARRWLMLWSRLALALSREPVQIEGLWPYIIQWRESEFLKLLALTVDGNESEGEALLSKLKAEESRGELHSV